MKKMFTLAALVAILGVSAFAADRCATIQGGTITDSSGNYLQTGYDQWGYNYQAELFNGLYDNNTRPAVLATTGDSLIMKWNDAWLSNQDCNNDGKLDRHYGYASYRGSGAWVTNHQSGTYEQDGKTQRWTYFSKIVAAPADATLVDGNWVGADGIVIGPAIWGDFAIVQEVYTDSGTGDHGLLYKSPARPGFGAYKP